MTHSVSTRPSVGVEVESEASLVISHDEFMMAVDRDEFLEVTHQLSLIYQCPRNISRFKLVQESMFTLDCN